MKKVIGLCLVVLLSSTSVFARENRRMDKRKMDPSALLREDDRRLEAG